MAYQIALLKRWGDPDDIFWLYFDYFMRSALLLEIAIIYGSLGGRRIKATINAGLDCLRSLPPFTARVFCGLRRDPLVSDNSENPQ